MKVYFIFFFLVISFSANSQNAPHKIFWVQDGLTWNDFKARPVDDSTFDANTNAGLSFSWGLKNDNGKIELTYEVTSYFNPYLSWVKVDSDSDYLLKHEQIHFDITELHARKLRKKLAEVNQTSLLKDPKKILNSIYQSVENERSSMQLEFDKESLHSQNKEGEARWRKFIRTELLKYEEVNS